MKRIGLVASVVFLLSVWVAFWLYGPIAIPVALGGALLVVGLILALRHQSAPTGGKDYLWAELGALVGALLAAVPAGMVFGLFVIEFWEQVAEGDLYLNIEFTAAAAIVMLGSSFGCGLTLKKAGYSAATRTAGILFGLLLIIFLIAVASTAPGFELFEIPASLLSPAALIPLLMPLLARWLTRFSTARRTRAKFLRSRRGFREPS